MRGQFLLATDKSTGFNSTCSKGRVAHSEAGSVVAESSVLRMMYGRIDPALLWLQTVKLKLMKLLISLLLICCSTPAFSQCSKANNIKLIENLLLQSFDSIWGKLDKDNISNYYTDDFLLLEHGEVWNNDTIANYLDMAKLRKPNPTRENRIEVIDVKVFGDRAWIAYHNYATFTIDNEVLRQAHWLESATAVLTKEGWRLDMLHSTRMKSE